MRILVTGITGAIGAALAPRLAAAGHDVRGMARDPTRATVAGTHGIPVLRADAVSGEGLAAALDGIEVAYYLIHSMEPNVDDFAVRDRLAAERFRDAAVRNVEWALAQQQENGWFPHNCLFDDTQPYTHTIAYAQRGVLEIGAALGNERYIAAAVKIGEAMLKAQPPSGAMPGRFDRDWRPTVRWSCLTGVAQLAINWARLYQLTADDRYRQATRRANRFLKTTQKLDGDPDERGGIKGSHPIDGKYHPWQYPNWAAKFFADSLMLEDQIFGAGQEARRQPLRMAAADPGG